MIHSHIGHCYVMIAPRRARLNC